MQLTWTGRAGACRAAAKTGTRRAGRRSPTKLRSYILNNREPGQAYVAPYNNTVPPLVYADQSGNIWAAGGKLAEISVLSFSFGGVCYEESVAGPALAGPAVLLDSTFVATVVPPLSMGLVPTMDSVRRFSAPTQ
jgi:hypothetical protein